MNEVMFLPMVAILASVSAATYCAVSYAQLAAKEQAFARKRIEEETKLAVAAREEMDHVARLRLVRLNEEFKLRKQQISFLEEECKRQLERVSGEVDDKLSRLQVQIQDAIEAVVKTYAVPHQEVDDGKETKMKPVTDFDLMFAPPDSE